MAYVYKGKHTIAAEEVEHAEEAAERRKSKCGTYAGHRAHRSNGEPACGPCHEAHNAYHRAYQRQRRAGRVLTPEEREAPPQSEVTRQRIEDLEMLASAGVDIAEAVERAGWPTIAAATATLYRYRHPLANPAERVRHQRRKAAA